MRNGVCSPQPPLVPLTSGNGSGSWPTPRAVSAPRSSAQGTAGPTLAEVALGRDGSKMWPTPRASMNENRTTKPAPTHGVTHGATLAGTAALWPTPQTADGHKLSGQSPETAARKAAKGQQKNLLGAVHASTASRLHQTTPPDGLSTPVRADLNPRFVEALMGLPHGWLTSSISEATGSSRSVPPRPSASSQNGRG